MEASQWFSVRTIYEHLDLQRGQDRLYEERIVLIRASTPEEAIEKAEAEARQYAVDGVKYLDFASGYEMFDEPLDGKDIYSLMRTSRMGTKSYIDRFFDTGRERSQRV